MQSVNDVISTIARVKPGTIVLELDETRYKKLVDSFEQGDPFKAPLRQGDSLLKAIKLSLTGNVRHTGHMQAHVHVPCVRKCVYSSA